MLDSFLQPKENGGLDLKYPEATRVSHKMGNFVINDENIPEHSRVINQDIVAPVVDLFPRLTKNGNHIVNIVLEKNNHHVVFELFFDNFSVTKLISRLSNIDPAKPVRFEAVNLPNKNDPTKEINHIFIRQQGAGNDFVMTPYKFSLDELPDIVATPHPSGTGTMYDFTAHVEYLMVNGLDHLCKALGKSPYTKRLAAISGTSQPAPASVPSPNLSPSPAPSFHDETDEDDLPF